MRGCFCEHGESEIRGELPLTRAFGATSPRKRGERDSRGPKTQ